MGGFMNALLSLASMGDYEDRKIGRHDDGTLFLSTAWCIDTKQPYETAVRHPDYNNGDYIMVAYADTPEEARENHAKWLAIMTAAELPESLTDRSQSFLGQMAGAAGQVHARCPKAVG